MVYKQQGGIYPELPMNLNTVQVQDCTRTLTEMNECEWLLKQLHLHSSSQIDMRTSCSSSHYRRLCQAAALPRAKNQTREGIRYLIGFHGKLTNNVPVEGHTPQAAVTGRSPGNTSKSHFPITVSLVIALLKYPCGTGCKPPLLLGSKSTTERQKRILVALVI